MLRIREKFISGDHKKFKSGFSGDSLISLATFSFTADPFLCSTTILLHIFYVFFINCQYEFFSDHSAFDSSV